MPTQRLAKIVLPAYDNGGARLFEHHNNLAASLVERFGGATAYSGAGLWRNPEGKTISEPVGVYDVAMADTPENKQTLRGIATRLATEARQQAVFVAYADGEVELVAPALPAPVLQVEAPSLVPGFPEA